MIEIAKTWLMCRIFRRNEREWDKTEVIKEVSWERINDNGVYRNLTAVEKGNEILRKLSKAKDYGVAIPGLIGAYLHRYRPWRRYKNWKRLPGDLLNYDGNNPKHQKVFTNAHSTLNNCIDDDLIKCDNGALFLTSKGRKFARTSHPFEVFFSWYPIKTAVGWGIPLLLIYIFTHYLHITIQSK